MFGFIHELLKNTLVVFHIVESEEDKEKRIEETRKLLKDENVPEMDKFNQIKRNKKKYCYDKDLILDHVIDMRETIRALKDPRVNMLLNYLEALTLLLNSH